METVFRRPPIKRGLPGEQNMRGTLKWYNRVKGFGFITAKVATPEGEAERDFFVHYTELDIDKTKRKSLSDGDVLDFEPAEGEKGPRATRVRLVAVPDPAA